MQTNVDAEIISITPTVYYSRVYVWNGQMRIGLGDPSPATLSYDIVVRRNPDNAPVSLVVVVSLWRTNAAYTPNITVNSATITLSPLQQVSLTLTWYEDGVSSSLPASPTGVQWTIYARVDPIGATDINPANNVMTDSTTTAFTGLVGDFNGDGTVDIYDALILSACYGTSQGDPTYNPVCNLSTVPDPETGLQTIDIYDAIILAGNFNNSM